jgi:hypothetical protein
MVISAVTSPTQMNPFGRSGPCRQALSAWEISDAGRIQRHALQRLVRHPGVPRGGDETVAQMLAEGELVIGKDHRQPVAAPCDKARHGLAGEGLVVEIDKRMGRRELGAPVADKGQARFHQQTDARIEAFGAGEQETVGEVVAQDRAHRRQPVLAGIVRDDGDGIAGAAQGLGDARQELVGEAEELVLGVQEQRDDLCAAGPQAARGAVGHVAQALGRLGDRCTGARGDSLIVRQGAGYGRHGKPRRLRDGAQRRFLGVCKRLSGLGFARHLRGSPVSCVSVHSAAFFKRFNTHAAPRLHCRSAEIRMKNRTMRKCAGNGVRQFRVDFALIYNVSIHQSDKDLGLKGGTI